MQIELLKSVKKRREYFLLHMGWEQPVFCNSLGLELGKKVIGGVCPTKGEEEMHGCVLQKERRRWGGGDVPQLVFLSAGSSLPMDAVGCRFIGAASVQLVPL